ncbi:hypothetical protein G6F57_006246 [Rhizopus arrhizus]|uniref:Uncharacterized protein n=1 Tax=Rhizopus oryzae TaxID=64495 RepID=A0A9P7BRM9_RHIOR|nr:hypothetical protein G6F24_006027 [Rhizopus arrhizus]KAG0799534.1 hypothetical protein G6F22_003129 [Rhizopus arrhizus]KAG0811650.1 hypothetical protein G6F20_006999 [Rhizopus arrhizus]KAG0869214.1 hypothetical protein G6F16_007468 [Rhizopus arrhizus]KAG0889511.1 hypothetical protein G6F15_000602 [Rhizopus arrhizus]
MIPGQMEHGIRSLGTQDYQRIQIKQWSDIDPAQGTFAVLVDDTWRIGSTRSTFECLVYILPAKVQPLKEINNALSEYPTPVHINVAQVALPLTTATIATAAPTSSTMTISSTLSIPLPTFSTSNEMKKDQDTLQPWVISAVSLAILAAIGTCISLCWIVRKRRLVYQENQPSVNESREENFFENNASSMTMVNPVVCRKTLKSEASSLHFQSTVSLCKEPLLTSTDALLIADTFRQKMRCPEWYQQEEERRRQKGKELLKKELEAEGTLVKKVGKSLLNDSNTHPS